MRLEEALGVLNDIEKTGLPGDGMTAEQWLERIIEQKKQRRRELAALPFEAKVEIVLQLQEVARTVREISEREGLRKPRHTDGLPL